MLSCALMIGFVKCRCVYMKEKSVSRCALHFSIGTFFSRIAGLFREQVSAYFFGTSPFIASFLVAYRFAMVLRRLLGEGALLTGVIPKFESLKAESDMKAALFFKEVYSSLSWFLLSIIICLEGFFALTLHLLNLNEANKEIITLIMMILPSLFFITLYALSAALLQCEKRFFFPSFAPAIFSISWSLLIWWVCSSFAYRMILGLSLSTIFAFSLQWLILAPSTMKFFKRFFALKELLKFSSPSPEIRTMLKSISLTVVGVGAYQINALLDTLFARSAALEGPAYLYYASRLYQFPVALIGIALSSAILPRLSKAYKEGEEVHFKELIDFGINRSLCFMLPATFAIMSLGLSSVDLIYHRGNFTDLSLINTTIAFWAFGLGLLPTALVLILNQAFYAKLDYKTPMKAALLTVLSNTSLNIFFIYIVEGSSQSVALATSLCSFFNVYYLKRKLDFPLFSFLEPKRAALFGKLLFSSSSASLLSLCVGRFLGDQTIELIFSKKCVFSTNFVEQVLTFFIPSLVFGITFLLSIYLLKGEELLSFLGLKKKADVSS